MCRAISNIEVWRLALLLTIAPAACAGPPGAPPPAPRLRVEVTFEPDAADPGLRVLLSSDADLSTWGPWRLDAPAPRLGLWTSVDGTGGERQELHPDPAVSLPAGARSLEYRFPLRADEATPLRACGSADGQAWALLGTSYLLRPERPPPGARVELAFASGAPLLPWPLEAARDLPLAALSNGGYHAFGGRRLTARAGETDVELAVLGALALPDDALLAWARQAVEEAVALAPAAPRRLTITVIPSAGDSIPFGVQRAGSLAVLVGAEAGVEALRRDWVLVHEVSHAALPYFEDERPGRSAMWLREGLATYFTEVARLRSGRLAPEEAWGNVLEGATDGRRRAGGADLRTLCVELHARRAYRSVYWGGALFVLDLDLALRRAGRTLRDALAAVGRPAGGPASVDDLRRATDALAGPGTFDGLLARHLEGPALRDAPAILDRLGVRPGEATLHDDAPEAGLRRAIGAP